MVNSDFKDLFAELNAAGAEFLVVGAHALAAHGHVRATKDLDVWVRPSAANAPRVLRALASFGAPVSSVSEADLATPGTTIQIGIEPVRIDILTAIDGVEFDPAWSDRVAAHFGDQEVFVLSRAHLIENKRASGRTQDLADIEALEKLRQDQHRGNR
jgi:hypothetical protein